MFKVKLRASSNINELVTFDVTPGISESRSVRYEPLTPVHMPGSIYVYSGTDSRTFSLDVKLISRTYDEATKRQEQLQLMRSWTMPRFGLRSSTLGAQQKANRANRSSIEKSNMENFGTPGTIIGDFGVQRLGAPPEVLYFSAYTRDAATVNSPNQNPIELTNLYRIPVVITSLSISYPPDIAYIETFWGDPFPVLMDVKIDIAETHSPGEYRNFSLNDFKKGKLPNF